MNAQCFPNNKHCKKNIFFCSCSSKLRPSWLLCLRCCNSITKESNTTYMHVPLSPHPHRCNGTFLARTQNYSLHLTPACMSACKDILAAINLLCSFSSATSPCQGNSYVPQEKMNKKTPNKQAKLTHQIFEVAYIKFQIYMLYTTWRTAGLFNIANGES